MKKTLIALAMASTFGIASTQALALDASTDAVTVTIEEGAVNGTSPNQFQADQLNGNYDEVFTVTGPNTFNTVAVFDAGGWFNNGNPAASFLNTPGADGYSLYALFQSDGNFAFNGGNTVFTGASGTIELWADPLRDTINTLPAEAAAGADLTSIIKAGDGEDQLLGTASLLNFGEGTASTGSGANGDFELIFGDWALNAPDGFAYFLSPQPFPFVLDLNGNFQEFNLTSVTPVGTTFTLLQNSANAFFAVPEPATLAMLGLGLAGMSRSLRRRKA